MGDRYDVRESRSVRSVWVWRGFLLLSLVAVGVAVALASNGNTSFAVLWGIIAAGWFAISMWLWRMHSTMEEQEYRRLLSERGAADAAAPRARSSARRSSAKRSRKRR